MTTDTRSPAELPDMSDAADRKAVFALALLRDVRHVFRADVDPGAEYGAKLAQQRLLGRRAEVGCAHDLQHDVIQRSPHGPALPEPGNGRQGPLRQRHAGDRRAVAALQIVGDAPRDPLHERQSASAGAAAIRRDPDVLDAVTDEGHAAIDEVSDDDRPLLPRGGLGTVRPQEFDEQVLDVEVQALMSLAFTGDQRHLLRAVAVRHLAAERQLDHLTFACQQHHGSGNDAAWPQVADAVRIHVPGKHVQRVRMAEENFRLAAPPAGDEILDRALIEIDRIQIDEAVDERRPHALLERLGQRRIAPQGGDLHAVEATGPLIRTQGIRAADLEPVAIEVSGERHARRAACAVLPDRAARKFARQNLIRRGANIRLGEEGELLERRQPQMLGIEALCPEYALIVSAMSRRVTQDLAETLRLARLEGLERQPLRALELAQDAQPPAAVLQVPQRVEHMPRQ